MEPSLASSLSLKTADTVLSTELSNHRLTLLQDAIVQFNSTAARHLLQELTDIRSTNNGTDQQRTIDILLNDLLDRGPDRRIVAPWLFRFRKLARFSKRTRWASLRRTLDLTTPPPNEDDTNEYQDTLEDQQRRRRRALVALLRQLSNPSDESATNNFGGGVAIVKLENKARRERQAKMRNEDWVSRRPKGLETPQYEVLFQKARDGFEIRRYQPFSLCTVSMGQPRPVDAYKTDATVSDPATAGARSFGALAGYLFGKNTKKESMAMTTPVLTRGPEGSKRMSFVLPSQFWDTNSLQEAPKPLEGSGVTLEQDMGGDRAVVMFGGYASKQETEKRKKELLRLVSQTRKWEPVPDDPIALCQYNDPFTPPWKRLNEVSVLVQPIQ